MYPTYYSSDKTFSEYFMLFAIFCSIVSKNKISEMFAIILSTDHFRKRWDEFISCFVQFVVSFGNLRKLNHKIKWNWILHAMQMNELSSSIQQFVRQLVWIRAIYWRIDVKDIKQNSMLPADLFSSTRPPATSRTGWLWSQSHSLYRVGSAWHIFMFH